MALPAITNWDASVAGVLFGAQEYLWWEWGGMGIIGHSLAHDAYLLCEFILSPGVLLV